MRIVALFLALIPAAAAFGRSPLRPNIRYEILSCRVSMSWFVSFSLVVLFLSLFLCISDRMRIRKILYFTLLLSTQFNQYILGWNLCNVVANSIARLLVLSVWLEQRRMLMWVLSCFVPFIWSLQAPVVLNHLTLLLWIHTGNGRNRGQIFFFWHHKWTGCHVLRGSCVWVWSIAG